jgi:hypothetical protein
MLFITCFTITWQAFVQFAIFTTIVDYLPVSFYSSRLFRRFNMYELEVLWPWHLLPTEERTMVTPVRNQRRQHETPNTKHIPIHDHHIDAC